MLRTMREAAEELRAAHAEVERLTSEVSRLRDELEATRRNARRQGPANGGEALLMAEKQREPLDLLLTGVVMPGMNGRELSERLRTPPGDECAVHFRYTEDMVVRRGIMDEVMHSIGKPYSLQALAEKVRRVLDTDPVRRGPQPDQ